MKYDFYKPWSLVWFSSMKYYHQCNDACYYFCKRLSCPVPCFGLLNRHPKQVSAVCCVKHVLMSHCWKYWSVDSRKENASKEEFQRLQKWSFSLRSINEMWLREEWWTWALFVVWMSCARTSLLPLFSLSQQKQLISFIIPEIPHHYSTRSSGSEDCGFTILRSQQINWMVLRSGRADKCEKLHVHHLT